MQVAHGRHQPDGRPPGAGRVEPGRGTSTIVVDHLHPRILHSTAGGRSRRPGRSPAAGPAAIARRPRARSGRGRRGGARSWPRRPGPPGPVSAAAGPSAADVVDGRPGPGRGRRRRARRPRPPPARPGRAGRRGGSRRSPRPRGRRPGRRRPPRTDRPPRSSTTPARHRVAGDREPRAAAQPLRARPPDRAAPRAGASPPAAGGARATSSPSEPARWATTRRAPRARRPRPPRRWRRPGVATISSVDVPRPRRDTSSRAAEQAGDRPADARRARRPTSRPARPGPIDAARVGRRSEPASDSGHDSGPTLRTRPAGLLGPVGRHDDRGPGRPAAPARTAARTSGGAGSAGRARRSVAGVDPEDVDVERARAPALLADAVGRRLEPVAHAEQLAGRQVGVELDHQVEVRRPGPSGPPTGSVSYTGETATTPASDVDRLAEVRLPIAQVRAEAEEGPHASAGPCAMRDRPRWPRSTGTGGRSLRTVTVTAATRSSSQRDLGDALGQPLEQREALGRRSPSTTGSASAP